MYRGQNEETQTRDTVPLWLILSMEGSSQQKVAKWLDRILQPVLLHYSTYCIKDSFEFAGFIRKCSPLNKFMCPFDIRGLFTCAPILETINIRADMLYRSYLTPPDIPEVVFVQLIKFATTSVEFSFDNMSVGWNFDGFGFVSYNGWYFRGFPWGWFPLQIQGGTIKFSP